MRISAEIEKRRIESEIMTPRDGRKSLGLDSRS